MNYTTQITALKRKDVEDFKDVVTHVSWQLTGTSHDGYKGHFLGATPIEDFSQLDELTFIPYQDLREEQIITWIEGVLAADPDYKQHIIDFIKGFIDSERELSIAEENSLPWVES